jgi:hypothetical protein
MTQPERRPSQSIGSRCHDHRALGGGLQGVAGAIHPGGVLAPSGPCPGKNSIRST